jgi:hypothetical protein
MRKLIIPLLFVVLSTAAVIQAAEKAKNESSRCHVFVDYENIWTLEMVETRSGERVPILNIITFTSGEWELRPQQIHIYNNRGREARIDRFSIDTGIADEPYLTPVLRVLANSFIGVDLVGRFRGFEEPQRVTIDLGEHRFELVPIPCLEYDTLAEKINGVNFDSPNIREDFAVLRLEPMGKRAALPKPRR